LAAVAYRRYQANLQKAGVVDFDDLLLLTERLFREHAEARRAEAGRFDHVLVDEYQDTNRSQYEIVRGLAGGHRNLCVVGDDDQSIYAWRGAEVTHILRFRDDWPEAKVVRLEENYRCRKPIIDYANQLIVHNAHRHEKALRPTRNQGEPPRILQCKDEVDEAEKVVGEIVGLLAKAEGGRGKADASGPGVWRKGEGFGDSSPSPQPPAPSLQPRDVAILFRTNEQPRAFEAELRKANVPYVLVGGMSFFDRREVRDVMAYLRLVANPDDEPSLLRVLNTPPRGIGDSARKRLMERAVERGKPLSRVLPEAHRIEGLSPAAVKGADELRGMVANWRRSATNLDLDELVKQVIAESRYRAELQRLYPDHQEFEARVAAVEEVVNAAAAFKPRASVGKSLEARLGAFLDDLALGERDDPDGKDAQLGRNAVALMTLHSAKGLEFPHVYLVGLEEGILPHKRSVDSAAAGGGDASIDEERRLAYVGVTRARDRLTLSLALSRRKWGKKRDSVPSRFLFEMTGQAERAPHAKPQKKAGTGRRKPAGAKASRCR
ncbi:MAG: 3'-5' exonuclease, partial [Planctomycetota bacterium]